MIDAVLLGCSSLRNANSILKIFFLVEEKSNNVIGEANEVVNKKIEIIFIDKNIKKVFVCNK